MAKPEMLVLIAAGYGGIGRLLEAHGNGCGQQGRRNMRTIVVIVEVAIMRLGVLRLVYRRSSLQPNHRSHPGRPLLMTPSVGLD